MPPRWIWNEIRMNEEMRLLLKKKRKAPNDTERKTRVPISALDSIIKDLLPANSDSDSEETGSEDDEEGGHSRAVTVSPNSPPLLILCAESCQLRILFEIIISIPSSSHYILQDISSTNPQSHTATPPTNTPHIRAPTHHFSDQHSDALQSYQQIFLSSNLVEMMRTILLNQFFFDSSSPEKWNQFVAVMESIDPMATEQCLQQLVTESCCQQFEITLTQNEMKNDISIERICEDMIRNIDIILAYLQQRQQQQLIKPGQDSSIIYQQRVPDLSNMLINVSTAITCLYAVTVFMEEQQQSPPVTSTASTDSSLSFRISQQILSILSLPWEWSKYLVTSLSLFLESHPPTSPLENAMTSQQSQFLHRLLSSSGDGHQEISSLPSPQSLRDSLLCHLIQSSFIFTFLLNVLLTLPSSVFVSGEEPRESVLSYQTISLQLFGLILGVAQSDLDEIFLELSKRRRSKGDFRDSSRLSEWIILFPYLKLLCWRLMGTSSPKTDSEDCLNTFTNKLEVPSLPPCPPLLLSLPHSCPPSSLGMLFPLSGFSALSNLFPNFINWILSSQLFSPITVSLQDRF
jgi:hypothetical protein